MRHEKKEVSHIFLKTFMLEIEMQWQYTYISWELPLGVCSDIGLFCGHA